ncbi:hypothetical protein [Neopusillimonas aromaticivorans]|uniref:hypothetical protein n=1 Tax=Neopusillimonas aromaticivorans TaxID=2979868 RepID=UPI00259ADAD3|nr:hypothetical protein [Neopusillimonas aromaticivorans]WJJ93413.1 hypothetical protein N7E01_15840 [Neopusillimonas aromaticivorans]WJJ94031.1 hypothetical protein N7E01_02295 [Neopusillimonas aromaticivorans]
MLLGRVHDAIQFIQALAVGRLQGVVVFGGAVLDAVGSNGQDVVIFRGQDRGLYFFGVEVGCGFVSGLRWRLWLASFFCGCYIGYLLRLGAGRRVRGAV